MTRALQIGRPISRTMSRTKARTLSIRALALPIVLACIGTAAAQSVDAYRLYIDAYARGQIDDAAALFTDDAVVTVGPTCSPHRPCAGKAAIRERYLAVLIAMGAGPPIRDQYFDGRRLSTRGEEAVLIGPGRSVQRLKGGHVFELRGNRIAAIHFELDQRDAETAQYLRSLAPTVSALSGR